MNIEIEAVDMRQMSQEERAHSARVAQLVYLFNHTMPKTPAFEQAARDLFGDNLGEGSSINPPIAGSCVDTIKIGRNVRVNSNLLAMARGGITIEDDAMIAANVQLITNNHDEYDRKILTCRPIVIEKGAWIGAGATVLPGIRIGKYAIIGAASVVTRDIPDYAVAVGNPARVIKYLEASRFEKN